MAGVRLSGATKRFGAVEVLKGIDLDIADGEFVVFVGPSGCGKSTLLRVVAGLEDLDAGEVAIGGRRMNDVAPSDRGIAMVFQSYALYPHMTVRENLGFALKLARTSRAEVDAAVARAAATLGLEELLDRKPAALSGGQRQRVAIGRAIVRSPGVFLFDEPLSNLDAALRVRMRYEFAALHRALATTMIYVTHDQAEAMTLADRIVVLRDGRIEQIGRPLDLYERPANLFVAGFIGSPAMNFLPARVAAADGGGLTLETAGGARIVAAAAPGEARAGDAVTIGIRPERIAATGAANRLSATVRFVEALGNTTYAHLAVPGMDGAMVWQVPDGVAPVADAAIEVVLPAERLHVFDAEGRAFARLADAAARDAA